MPRVGATDWKASRVAVAVLILRAVSVAAGPDVGIVLGIPVEIGARVSLGVGVKVAVA